MSASGKSDADSGVLMGASAPAGQDPLVGKRFGNCLLQRKIGAGAMGWVYLAHHVGLNKPVAIKIMSAELIGAAGNVERFLREARLAASLEHPNVVQVFDVGEANGLYYLAMQYVEGRSLDKLLEAKGKLEVREASNIVKKIGLALGAAHRLGIVHRDIKPANVLLSKDGQIKVADFGLARSADAEQSLSMTGQIVGTPYYMSPEQAQGVDVDARADLYSLGATFYHLLTGKRPFLGDTPISIILKHVNEAPEPPDKVEPSIPPAVGQIVLKLMAKRPDDRFPTAEDFVRALVGIEAGGSATLAPGAEKILELGGESLLDMGPSKKAPAPKATEPPKPTTRISKEFQGKDETPEGKLKAEGKPVVGKYLLLREIQKEDEELSIWEAENVRTRARVALRMLRGHDSDRIRSFYKLAAEGTHLKHPNILHVVECHSDTDAKGVVTHFIAVELVSVLPLEAVVSARMLPPKELLKLAEQVAQALEHAHQKGKTHLTLSPRTTQVEPPSRAIISFHEFGPSTKDEARAKEEALADAPFMAPEQVPNVDEVPDAATDVYRLGAMLYWIATGKPLFEASSLADYYQKILSLEPRAPRELDPKIDPELEKIILKATRKEKELRYAKAGELAEALRRFLKTEPKEGAASPATRRVIKKTWKTRLQLLWKSRKREILGVGVSLAVLAALGVGARVLRTRWAAEALAEELGRLRLEALNRYSEGKFEEALVAARKALSLFANDGAMENLAKTCQRRVLEANALRELARLEEAVDEAAFLERSAALGRAVKALRAALGLTPGTEELGSIVAAGLGALALREPDVAAGALDRALSMDSKDPAAALGLARACFDRDVLANAVARAMGGPEDRDPRAREWRSKIFEAAERPTQPPREGADADLADLYAAFGRGENERVKALVASFLRRSPAPGPASEALLLRAWVVGDPLDLDAALKARPLQSLGYLMRALFALERGKASEAAADLDVLLRLFPNQPVFGLLRAKARHAAGDRDGAVTDLTRVKLLTGKDWEYAVPLRVLEDSLPERVSTPK